MLHAKLKSSLSSSSRKPTKSPCSASPVTTRSISGGLFGFTNTHIILRVRLLFLGGVSDGNSGSLEALPRRDDDEGDHGFQVYSESALLSGGHSRLVSGERMEVTDLYPLRHLES